MTCSLVGLVGILPYLLTFVERRFNDVIGNGRHFVVVENLLETWSRYTYWIRLAVNVVIQEWVVREADQPPGAIGIKLSTESIDTHDRQLRQAANREG